MVISKSLQSGRFWSLSCLLEPTPGVPAVEIEQMCKITGKKKIQICCDKFLTNFFGKI